MELESHAPPRDKFLPVEIAELAQNLISELGSTLGPEFERFTRLYLALHRAKLADKMAQLKSCYRKFDPDSDMVTATHICAATREELHQQLHSQLTELLCQANYLELTQDEFLAALNKTSPRGLRVSVDMDEFEELGLHYRGLGTRVDETRDWRSLYLKKIKWNTPIYRRLFLFFRLRVDPNQSNQSEQPQQSDFLYLKLFRDVPQSDLEMLLPNTRVRMRAFDKVKLSVTGGGGTIGGVLATITKIGAAANPVTWVIALAGLGGILWRQVTKVFAQRTRYMADLAQQLYFCNLDNNFGALVHLSELACNEESKEALLAYAFLCRNESGLSQLELDQKVENYLAEVYDVRVDYEVEDGIAKLRRAGLLLEDTPECLRVISPNEAVALMDQEWDKMFSA